ncbi:nucleoside-diphosphate kinase [Candidatus Peregrinibacteria bacterium CG10_big_fil_rev_8_21_14_0_10_55_24]|nr:MAG: nucleoside-diphosphate kinase [Candidatus Peregrinibacteria bacterium CG10_big_fil_rev_8_21_14_0_10_55_24]
MERTLVLLKPDCMTKGLCGTVIARFEAAGFTILGCKMLALTPKVLREHYAHIADKPFYPDVETFMSSTPVIAMVLEGTGIIARMRDMLGVTDCLAAAPGTIRAEFGNKEPEKSKMENVVHASDSAETAQKEIARFFSSEELFAW